ncbi:unannotated protein [freshwater metagenome]|uniref:Unannotated protein n=1 Tax=freshwater metagenome TaxID=449393 RepID=A0A6J7CZY3_9ZZZZ|nr:SpoIIE family protein phosphatase [Actinomycetota bacterium]
MWLVRGPGAVMAVRIALIAALVGANVATVVVTSDSAQIGFGFLFALPVGLAAWWFGSRAGVLLAVLCVGLWIGAVALGFGLHAGEWEAAAALRGIIIIAVALLVSFLRARLGDLISAQAEVEALREALSPARIPELPGLEIAVTFRPAEHAVAGDFYLAQELHGCSVIIIGDVVGHGIRAARDATFARALLGSMAAGSRDPGMILGLANRVLCEAWDDENFLTAVCVVHDPAANTLHWALAGHAAPLSLQDGHELNGEFRGPPLGVTPEATFPVHSAAPSPGYGMLLFTDGVTEARRDGMLMGLPRVRDLVRVFGERPPSEIVDAIDELVMDFTRGRLRDDMCVIALRLK